MTGADSARSRALPCGKPGDDVDEDDVPEVLLGGPVGGGRPDVAGPHDRDLVAA
jgi:hypothetical protein